MEIQQHDGVVVEVAGFQQGFAKRCGRREVCHGREREVSGLFLLLPSLPPTIYRAKGEGGRRLGPSSKEGCGQGGVLRPQGTSEVPSPFRTLPFFLISWRMGLLGLVPLAHIGQGAPPHSPCGPPGAGGPLGGPPDPFQHSRYNTDKVRNFFGDQNKTSHI